MEVTLGDQVLSWVESGCGVEGGFYAAFEPPNTVDTVDPEDFVVTLCPASCDEEAALTLHTGCYGITCTN